MKQQVRLDLEQMADEWLVVATTAEVDVLHVGPQEGLGVVFRHPEWEVAAAWLIGALWGARGAYGSMGVLVEDAE